METMELKKARRKLTGSLNVSVEKYRDVLRRFEESQ